MIAVEFKAVAIAVFFFSITISGTIASLVVGTWIQHCGGDKCEDLDIIMTVNTAIPCLIGSVCFFMAGKPYEIMRKTTQNEREVAFAKAEGS